MTLDLTNIDLNNLVYDAIYIENRTNLFEDIRRLFYKSVCSELKKMNVTISQGQFSESTNLLADNFKEVSPIKVLNDNILDLKYCAKYGHTIYSVKAINYLYGMFTDYYSLQAFSKNENFSIGNIIIPVLEKEIDFNVIESKQIKIVGYSSDTRKSKKKPFLALIGIYFNPDALRPIIDKYLTDYLNPILDEVIFSTTSYPILFTCRKTGELFTCKCFEDHINWENDFYRFSPMINHHSFIKNKIKNITFLEGICHLCTNTTPLLNYGSSMYYSSFLVKFLPYYYLMNKKRTGDIFCFDKTENRLVENELRKKFGHYKIGEKWTNETLLFNMLTDIFADEEVVFHYRGKELEGLELDVWIPRLRVGFEYQGIQHFKSVNHWGGESSLNKQKQNDKRKKEICFELNYTLIEFAYNEEISKDLILRKLDENEIMRR